MKKISIIALLGSTLAFSAYNKGTVHILLI